MIYLLTQKETSLLNELKTEEQMSIEKYQKASSCASSPVLQALFQQIGEREQQHLNTINQIINGTVPPANSSNNSNSSSNSTQQPQNFAQPANYENTKNKQSDSYLCYDTLASEKFISSTYETSGFEFTEDDIRATLMKIQAEEHEHGKLIYDYMEQNGMYN